MRRAAASLVSATRRMVRDQVVRRVAFMLELIDRGLFGRRDDAIPEPAGPHVSAECVVLAVVAHWRGPQRSATDGPPEPLLECLEGLLTMTVRRLEIVVVTNGGAEATSLLRDWSERTEGLPVHPGAWDRPSEEAVSIRVEEWRPRWPRRHGFFLTWHHKEVFRRALDRGDFTHLIYLEDDMRLTAKNLDHWLVARRLLTPRGLLPGFVRFERTGDRRVLVDQTRSGQHEDGGPHVTVEGGGEAAVRISLRPYQAGYVMDRSLADAHFRVSPFRRPLRSNVARWDLRERAAAGPTFGPTPGLFGALLRPEHVRPPSRTAVLVHPGPSDAKAPLEGALIEHLRPTYSRDPSSRHGKLPVDAF